MTPRRALWLLIGTAAALHLAWASGLGGLTNEPYYYMYATELQWGFFDHPPMVGAVAALGLKALGGALPVLGIRLGFVALFAGSTWLVARLAARPFGPWAGVLAALVLNTTLYHGVKIATVADPDGPLLFFWLLTLDRLWLALERPERKGLWVAAGLAWGLAMASKYHAVLLIAGAGLYLLARPSRLSVLKRPGPYLAAAAGLAVFSPVIAWNAAHHWVSFFYQSNRAGGFRGLNPEVFLEAVVGQVLYLTPWLWAALLLAAVKVLRRGPRGWSDAEVFFLSQAVPALALFLGVATFRRIMPHWPLIGFIALMPLLGRDLAAALEARPAAARRRLAVVAAVPLLLGWAFLAQANSGLLQDGRGRFLGLLPARLDPTVDTIRWDQIARELERRGLLSGPNAFLFTDSWRFSSELALATRRALPVACYHRDARSFTFWSRPEDWVGRDGIYVTVNGTLVGAEAYAPWFDRVEPIAEFPVVRRGATMETVKLHRCVRQTAPFLFGYNGPGLIPRPGPELDKALAEVAVGPARAAR